MKSGPGFRARKSIGHSHVLPPDSRRPDRAWPVLCKLLHKACERLRSHALLTGSLTLRLDFPGGPPWSADAHTVETDSTIALMHLMERLWQDRPEPARHILKVGVVLTRLCAQGNHTPQLFPTGDGSGEDGPSDSSKHQRLDAAVDKLRARYGRGMVYFGSVQESRDAAPMRISFTHIPDPELEQD
jgi:DNA polymerase IV